MIIKTMLAATLALGVIGAPAMAQTTGAMAGNDMQSGAMAGNDGMAPKMTKMQTAAMKKCQAMPSDKMMKNKMCMKMRKMHSEMANPGM